MNILLYFSFSFWYHSDHECLMSCFGFLALFLIFLINSNEELVLLTDEDAVTFHFFKNNFAREVSDLLAR